MDDNNDKDYIKIMEIDSKERQVALLGGEIYKLEEEQKEENRSLKNLSSLYKKVRKIPFSFFALFLLLFLIKGVTFGTAFVIGTFIATPMVVISEAIIYASFKHLIPKDEDIKKYEKQKILLSNLQDQLKKELENIKNDTLSKSENNTMTDYEEKIYLIKFYVENEKELRKYYDKNKLEKYIDASPASISYIEELIKKDVSKLNYVDDSNDKKVLGNQYINKKPL